MSDDYGTTNPAREARETTKRQRGDLPHAPAGSAAEFMGYKAVEEAVLRHAADELPAVLEARFDAREYERERRDSWLRWRKTGIGGSDIAAIMGWGFANQSLYAVWAQKVGLIPLSDADENERWEYGRRAEPMIVEWFEDEMGLFVANQQEWRTHPEHSWALATIDGEVYDHPVAGTGPITQYLDHEPLGGIELKTASVHGWKVDDPIPDHYVCQGQWQMAVNGWERVWFAVLHDQKFRVYELEADGEDQAVLLEAAEHFWTEFVMTGDPPPIDDSKATRTTLERMYRGAHVETTVFMPDFAEQLTALRQAKFMVDRYEREVALWENTIKAQMGDATAADFGNGIEVTWSRFPRRSVDTKALKSMYPEVYDAVMRSKPSSAFRVKGSKEEEED